MPNAVVKEVGFYNDPESVGYTGWIRTIAGTYFINNKGKIVHLVKDDLDPRPEVKKPAAKATAKKPAGKK